MKFKEKREYSRAEVKWPVNISAAKGLIQGMIKNMSLGGAYIHLEEFPSAVSYGLGVRLKDMVEDDFEFLFRTVLR